MVEEEGQQVLGRPRPHLKMAAVCLFACRECYVYQIPPTSSASGHRANDWNVDKWLKEVSLKVKSEGDHCVASLSDMEMC